MKIQSVCSFFFLILFSTFLKAQHTNVLISNAYSPNEPSIVINPKNTNQMMAGANLSNAYTSIDGGLTWNADTLYSSYGVWGDPSLTVDTNGSFYFLHLSNPPFGNWIDRIICQKKDDIASAWTDGTYMGLSGTKAQDKQWPVVDPATNNIYVTWTQFDNYGSNSSTDSSTILFSGSTDGGNFWSAAKRISHYAGDCIDSDNTMEGAVPAVGPNGEIYVTWAGPDGLYFNKSLDMGNTWLPVEMNISDMPGGWDFAIPGIYRSNGLPVTCCDLSQGPHRGTIYVNWVDHRNGNTDPDVWLIKSSDGGQTWSTIRRVNSDGAGNIQFFTWMTVDQKTGYLYFVFYDRRNYFDDQTDVYMAVSKDGGETFIDFKISASPFTPISTVFFGDYTNISAYNNVIRPIWARCDLGNMSIWTAIIDSTWLGVPQMPQESVFILEQNAPNPFHESTMISFKLRHADQVSLKVFDAYGRLVYVFFENKKCMPGKYQYFFDNTITNVPKGIYHYSLETKEKVITKKMIIQ
jgi:hypothetical protein